MSSAISSPASLEFLAKEAKQHPAKTVARQVALGHLISGIQQRLPPARTAEEKEARQQVWFYVCRNIDNYEDGKPVMHWVNVHLKYRRRDLAQAQPLGMSLDTPHSRELQIRLETYQLPDAPLLPSQELVTWIEEDPDGLFRGKCFKKNPQASFRAIALQRIQGISWQDIAQKLGPGFAVGPVSTFFQRCCKEFAPQFQAYLQK